MITFNKTIVLLLIFLLYGCHSHDHHDHHDSVYFPATAFATALHIETKEMPESYLTSTVYGIHENCREKVIHELVHRGYKKVKDTSAVVWFQNKGAHPNDIRVEFIVILDKGIISTTPMQAMKHDFKKYPYKWFMMTAVGTVKPKAE